MTADAPPVTLPRRPALKPALRRVWRDDTTLQLGLDPAHGVIITGLDRAAAGLLDLLDGSRDLAGLAVLAERLGLLPDRLAELLDLLARSAALDDGSRDHSVLAELPQGERDRLAPDLAAASLTHPFDSGGVDTLTRRRRAVLQVVGAGRVGASVATLLAAAGVGAVLVEDTGATQEADVAPAGASPDDVGARRQDAALRAARRVSPSVRTVLPPGRRGPDLAVLAGPVGTESRVADRMMHAGTPHLLVRVRDTTGVVGPLVLPGRSSCQRCHDLHRTERDRGWPGVAAALSAGARDRTMPCDTVLATAVAAHAVLQVLAYLDGERPSAVDGTIEIGPSGGEVRRRSWIAHPSCGCSWDLATFTD